MPLIMSGDLSAELHEITIRPDWEAAEHLARAKAARRRIQFEVLLLAYGMVTIGLTLWRGSAPWAVLVHWVLFALILLVMPLWIALAGQPGRLRTIFRFGLAVAGAVTLAVVTTPVAYRFTPIPGLPTLDPRLALAIPLLTGGLLVLASRYYPPIRRTLGLLEPYWGRQLVIGLALGAALGLHMIGAIMSLPEATPIRPPTLGNLVWLVGVSAGLFAVGQEISLRGLLHALLRPLPGMRQIPALTVITALNLLLYIAPASDLTLTPTLAVCLAYAALFAFMAGALRLRSGSVIASMAANATFCVFLLTVFLG